MCDVCTWARRARGLVRAAAGTPAPHGGVLERQLPAGHLRRELPGLRVRGDVRGPRAQDAELLLVLEGALALVGLHLVLRLAPPRELRRVRDEDLDDVEPLEPAVAVVARVDLRAVAAVGEPGRDVRGEGRAGLGALEARYPARPQEHVRALAVADAEVAVALGRAREHGAIGGAVEAAHEDGDAPGRREHEAVEAVGPRADGLRRPGVGRRRELVEDPPEERVALDVL
mmetsp:Transcript_34881/g.118182  ORF Transcript_34881/g.118182 Transcript_34881/m.118182 type:complete len:229 (-) Transcript_34881:338-1024(-)